MEKRQGSYCSRWLNESLLFLNPHFAPVNLRKLISVSVRLPPTTPIEVCPFLARYSMTDWAACSSQVVTEERLSKSKSLLLLVNKRQGMWMWAKSSLKYSKLPPKKTIPFGLRSRQSWIA